MVNGPENNNPSVATVSKQNSVSINVTSKQSPSTINLPSKNKSISINRKSKDKSNTNEPSEDKLITINGTSKDNSLVINWMSSKGNSSAINGALRNTPFSNISESKQYTTMSSLIISAAPKRIPITTNVVPSEFKGASFSLSLKRAGNLKIAIGALIDSHLNPNGFGKIDADRKGVEITVWNMESRVISNLRLQPSYGKGFQYNKPFVSKMFNLNRVFDNLASAADEELITIYHVYGSTKLVFQFGADQASDFSEELFEPDAEYEKLPAITLSCSAALPSEHLRAIIPLMVHQGALQRVLVSTTHKNVTITVGNKEWRYNAEEDETKVWMRHEKQTFNGWFQWPHGESLMKASHLTEVFSVSCIDDPRECFMFRFIDYEGCDLAYIKLYDDFNEPNSPKVDQISTDRPKKQIPDYTFKFQLHPAGALKNALQSMTDYEFNGCGGLGMIEVSEFGVDVRVCNSRTGVIGLLHLVKSGLINFKCNRPVIRKMVNLDDIALNILLAHDSDFIAAHQLVGSNEITFKSGLHHIRTFPIKLLDQTVGGFKEFPYEYDIKYACQIMLPSEFFREVIRETMDENSTPELASVEIKSDGFFLLAVGEREWVCEDVQKFFGSDASQLPSRNYKVTFEWGHLKSLKWASFLADWFAFCIVADPPDSILMRFKLHDFGYLHYMKKASSALQKIEYGKQIQNN